MTDEDLITFEEPVGRVEAYDAERQRVLVRVERGELHEGDMIQFVGPVDHLVEAIRNLQIDDETVDAAPTGALVAIQVPQPISTEDDVYLVH